MKAGEEEPAAAVDVVEKIEETPAELQKTEPTQAEADDNKARNGQVDLLLRRSPDPAALADLEPNQIKPILTVNSQLKSTIDWYISQSDGIMEQLFFNDTNKTVSLVTSVLTTGHWN